MRFGNSCRVGKVLKGHFLLRPERFDPVCQRHTNP
jgi:hypothetical protein